ncbi:MAG: hypothetical protein HZB29_06970 [Nitrospinae bacterium]|nr:hypothetical protein [Nitrospinota bacterium]
MKIDGLDPLKNLTKTGSAKPSEPVSGQSFMDVLSGLTSKETGQTSAPSSMGAPIPLSGVPFIAPVSSDLSAIDASSLMNSLDSVLSDLSMFKNALGNNQIPLERLKPLMDELLARKDELVGFIGKIDDKELKSIVSDALNLVMDQANQYQASYAA